MTERPRDWPGLHVAKALVEGEPIEGYWFSRTQEYAARQRGETFDRLQYATPETVTLSPLPCWEHLPPETQKILRDAAATWSKWSVNEMTRVEDEVTAQFGREGMTLTNATPAEIAEATEKMRPYWGEWATAHGADATAALAKIRAAVGR